MTTPPPAYSQRPLGPTFDFDRSPLLDRGPLQSNLIGVENELSIELDLAEVAARLATVDKGNLSHISQGKALPTIELLAGEEVPNWTEKIKANIKSSFNKGLQEYKTTPEELTKLLKSLNISSMEITLENIQNPAYKAEVENIQEELKKRLGGKDVSQYGIAPKIGVDGQFGKNTIMALMALKDTDRGDPVSIQLTPLGQTTDTGCYRTAEAMLFNHLHKKEGTPDSYTEDDLRDRVAEADRLKKDFYVEVKSENENGRITFPRERGLALLDLVDQQLNEGKPALMGVSHSSQIVRGKNYNEGITDHYVLITGRQYDDQGVYYTFNDSAGGGKTGKLRFDPVSGKLSGVGAMAGIYDVTRISMYEPQNVESYKRVGKTMIEFGARSAEAKSMQIKLTTMNYPTKGTTGAFGTGTFTAVKAFQQNYNSNQKNEDLKINETGIVDTHTLRAINERFESFQKSNPDRVMFKYGDNNAMVSELQKILTKLTKLAPEHNFNTNGTNGNFGPSTQKAIEQFQKVYLDPPVPAENVGKIDNRTWQKILEIAKTKGIS